MVEKLETRATSAEAKLAKITEEKSELEAESIELRSRAETLNDDLQRARSESRIKGIVIKIKVLRFTLFFLFSSLINSL